MTWGKHTGKGRPFDLFRCRARSSPACTYKISLATSFPAASFSCGLRRVRQLRLADVFCAPADAHSQVVQLLDPKTANNSAIAISRFKMVRTVAALSFPNRPGELASLAGFPRPVGFAQLFWRLPRGRNLGPMDCEIVRGSVCLKLRFQHTLPRVTSLPLKSVSPVDSHLCLRGSSGPVMLSPRRALKMTMS
eukprot:5156707-Pleurochrysis_carterae.AAC.2